jgi:transcriptional regulator with XRE-family HTH domain
MELKLKELRDNSGATRRAVSAATGITEATLFNYEHGLTIPSLDVAGRIASYYGVTIDHLLGRDTEGGDDA